MSAWWKDLVVVGWAVCLSCPDMYHIGVISGILSDVFLWLRDPIDILLHFIVALWWNNTNLLLICTAVETLVVTHDPEGFFFFFHASYMSQSCRVCGQSGRFIKPPSWNTVGMAKFSGVHDWTWNSRTWIHYDGRAQTAQGTTFNHTLTRRTWRLQHRAFTPVLFTRPETHSLFRHFLFPCRVSLLIPACSCCTPLIASLQRNKGEKSQSVSLQIPCMRILVKEKEKKKQHSGYIVIKIGVMLEFAFALWWLLFPPSVRTKQRGKSLHFSASRDHFESKGLKFTSLIDMAWMCSAPGVQRQKKLKNEANRKRRKPNETEKKWAYISSFLRFAWQLFEMEEQDSWDPLQGQHWCWRTKKRLIAPSFSAGRKGWLQPWKPHRWSHSAFLFRNGSLACHIIRNTLGTSAAWSHKEVSKAGEHKCDLWLSVLEGVVLSFPAAADPASCTTSWVSKTQQREVSYGACIHAGMHVAFAWVGLSSPVKLKLLNP